jgi:hypothetical protein
MQIFSIGEQSNATNITSRASGNFPPALKKAEGLAGPSPSWQTMPPVGEITEKTGELPVKSTSDRTRRPTGLPAVPDLRWRQIDHRCVRAAQLRNLAACCGSYLECEAAHPRSWSWVRVTGALQYYPRQGRLVFPMEFTGVRPQEQWRHQPLRMLDGRPIGAVPVRTPSRSYWDIAEKQTPPSVETSR